MPKLCNNDPCYTILMILRKKDNVVSIKYLELDISNWIQTLQILFSCTGVPAKSLQLCPTLCDSTDCRPPGSSYMGFSKQEYWSGLPCPPPGNLPHPGIQLASLMVCALAGRFFTTRPTWEAQLIINLYEPEFLYWKMVIFRDINDNGNDDIRDKINFM